MHFRELTDRYSLDKILRSSRSGTVLRATDTHSGRTVAVKLIHAASPAELVQRAPQLDRLAAALEEAGHPALPAVIDSGLTTEGSAFLVMELLDGKTLDAAAGPPRRLLTLLTQALEGLAALAHRGVAHHNLSPDNLLVTAAPQGGQGKLRGPGTALSRGGAAPPVETARFRAPELAAGTAPDEIAGGDGRADLFSFALPACSVLGATVGPGESPAVQLPFALTLEIAGSEALRRTLERALRRDPAERPAHQELRKAFRLALGAAAAAEPSGAGDLLSFDEDLLSDLAPPPAAAAGKAAAPFANAPPLTAAPNVVPFQRRPMVAVAASEEPKPAGDPLRRSLLLAGIAAACVLAAGLGYWWLSRGGPENAAPPAAAAAPPPPPRRPATEVLAEAEAALGRGEDERAWEILGALTFADQSGLPPAGCRALQSLQQTLAMAARDRLPADLEKGLRTGDLGRLRFAVAAGGDAATALPAARRGDFERARGVVGLYSQAEEAAARQATVEVLERFAILAQQLPGATDPRGLREQAAAALEGEAQALAADGHYAEAQTHLAPLARTWPGRDGLKARLDDYQRYQRSEAQEEAALAALPTLERRKRPDEALEMLRGLEPTPHLAAQIAAARKRLEEELAQLDGQ